MSAILRTTLGRNIGKLGTAPRGFATAASAGSSGASKDPKQSQVQLAVVLAIGAAGAYYLFGDGFRSHRSEVSSVDPGSMSSKREKTAPSEGQSAHAPNSSVTADNVASPK